MRPDLEDYDDLNAELEEAPRSRVMSWAVLVVAVSGFAALAYYAYHTNSQSARDGEVLIVQADQAPIKDVPTDKQGEDFPNKDKTIYDVITPGNNAASEKSEKLLPEPEKPVAVQEVKPDEDSAAVESNTTTYVNKKLVTAPAVDPVDVKTAVKTEAVKAAPADKPAPQKTVKEEATPLKMPDNAAPSPAPAAQAKPAEKPAAAAKVAAADNAAAAPSASTPKFVNQSTVTSKSAPSAEKPPVKKAEAKPAVKPAEKPATKTVAAVAPAASGKGDYKIQLGAFKSEAEAQANWKKIAAKFPGTIGGAPIIVKATVGSGTFYRLRASGFASSNAAKEACAKLSAAKQACFPAGK